MFKNGRSRAVRIPREFDFGGDEVEFVREGDVVMLRPVTKGNGRALAALLDTFTPIVGWSLDDLDDPPPDDIDPFK